MSRASAHTTQHTPHTIHTIVQIWPSISQFDVCAVTVSDYWHAYLSVTLVRTDIFQVYICILPRYVPIFVYILLHFICIYLYRKVDIWIYHKSQRVRRRLLLLLLSGWLKEFILSIGYKLKTMKSIDWHFWDVCGGDLGGDSKGVGGCGIIMASGCASLGICSNTLTPFVCALELHWDSILDAQEKTYNYTLNSSIFKTGYWGVYVCVCVFFFCIM